MLRDQMSYKLRMKTVAVLSKSRHSDGIFGANRCEAVDGHNTCQADKLTEADYVIQPKAPTLVFIMKPRVSIYTYIMYITYIHVYIYIYIYICIVHK